MCGIVGYTGRRAATPILLEGLSRLEYRGYDSCGIAAIHQDQLVVRKAVGRISNLREVLDKHPTLGNTGIGHTRWATHGGVTEANAHPHAGGEGEVVVVHNGVIENHAELKRQLQKRGYRFASQTDTEVIAHLIASHLKDDLVEAVELAVAHLKGTYGLAVISPRFPGQLVCARLGSPLVLGLGMGEVFLASDPSALVGYAQQVVYLSDRQIGLLTPTDWQIFDQDRINASNSIHDLDLDEADTAKGAFEHYMLKEIFEQPEVIQRAMAGRIDESEASAHFGGLNLTSQQLRDIDRIVLTACGTSYHAALVGEYMFEQFARIPVEVEYASELRYRNPPLERGTVVIGITQSGETADTLAALREMKRKGFRTLGICNVVGSSIAREVDGGIYLHAGPEIGVASTKAFTAQTIVLALLAVYLGRLRHLSYHAGARILEELRGLPALVRETLECNDRVAEVAMRYHECRNMLYLGRQYLFPMALEGALKMKEISYIHAEGYAAGEMKHGPIALIDEETPTVVLIPRGNVYDKVMSNLEEIKARRGPIIAIATEGDAEVEHKADEVIFIPDAPEYLQPVLTAIPLQLLSYHVARLRGCDVDRPRNLAKSVTVE